MNCNINRKLKTNTIVVKLRLTDLGLIDFTTEAARGQEKKDSNNFEVEIVQ